VRRGLGVPLHHQVYLVLNDNIRTRRYPPDGLLPSEDELARTFGVSRITLRAALATLQSNGLVEKRHGIGTFVKETRGEQPLHASMADVLTHMKDVSARTTARVLEFDCVPGPTHVRAIFNLPADENLLRFVRVRHLRANAKPILFLTSYIPQSRGRHITEKTLKDASVRELLQHGGIKLTSGEQVVGAVLADPVVAKSLGVDVGAPLLQVQRIHRNGRKEPIWFLEALGSPSHFTLQMELGTDELRN
jgi:GntR family transcriptional regulator